MTVEPEIAAGRLAFSASQRAFDGAVARRATEVRSVSWHGTLVHPEDGAFAVARRGLEDLVGEIVRVSWKGRSVLVYVIAPRGVPGDLSLSRAAFLRIAPLSADRVPAVVEVIE